MILLHVKAISRAKVENLVEKYQSENEMDNKIAHAKAKIKLVLYKKRHSAIVHVQISVPTGAFFD